MRVDELLHIHPWDLERHNCVVDMVTAKGAPGTSVMADYDGWQSF